MLRLVAFRATSKWAVVLSKYGGLLCFSCAHLKFIRDTMRDGAWELQQISCTKYDIWFLDGIHGVFAATSVIIWPCRIFCSFEFAFSESSLGFSWGKASLASAVSFGWCLDFACELYGC